MKPLPVRCLTIAEPTIPLWPTEVDLLLGDPSKAEKQLGWKPKYDLKMLVKEMMESDLELFKKDKYLKEGGHNVLNYHE